MTKQGELEQLQFPSFRRELLFQNHWSPSDDLGRIKVLISEGFPRDSPSNPIERVKNVVAFAFQHAPLGQSFLALYNVGRADLVILSSNPRDQRYCLAQPADVASASEQPRSSRANILP